MIVGLSALLIGLSSFAAAIAAFLFPLEIETREAPTWLHVLALKAGVNIYDHTRVAYVNMNHGPVDPLFKTAISYAFPFLDSGMVIRISVFLLPFAFWIVSFRLLARIEQCSVRFLSATLCAFSMYSTLLWLSPFNMLIGRSDPTAVLLLLGLMALLYEKSPSNGFSRLRCFGVGMLGALVMMTNTRFDPIVVLLITIAAAQHGLRANEGIRTAASEIFLIFLGGAAVFLTILGTQLHWNLLLYGQLFFGLFITLIPVNSVSSFSHFAKLLVLSPNTYAAIVGSVFFVRFFRNLVNASDPIGTKELLFLWVPAFFALLAGSVACFYLNFNAGGFYYFSSFLLFVWYFVLTHVDKISPRPISLRESCGVLVACSLLSLRPVREAAKLLRTIRPAYQFMAQLREINAQNPLVTEDSYFYLKRWSAQKIDIGDSCYILAEKKLFDPAYNEIVQSYVEELLRNPPRYIYTGLVMSTPMQQLIRTRYRPYLESPPHFFAHMNLENELGHYGTSILWERKS